VTAAPPARRLLRVGPFAAVALFSIVVLFSPASAAPPLVAGLDKLVHLGLFAALALTGRWAGLRPVALAGCLAGYAVGSEVLQGLLPLGRTADVLDGLVDLVGVALGLVAAARLVRS
jgi:VanZ family protein